MKNTLRTLAVLGASTLALASCGTPPSESGSGGGSDKGGSDFKACMVSDSGGFKDKSFNESGYRGLQEAKKDLGVETQTAESQSADQFVPNIDTLVSGQCDLIFTVGFLLASATADEAKANPDTKFAIIDATAQDKDGNPIEVDNVKPVSFDTAQASFLAGYLAAGMTKTGKVATYGGAPIPTVTIFMDGFVDGVAQYNKDHDKDVKTLGWDKDSQKGSFVGNFEDQTKGKSLSDSFYDQGADIIMPVAGPVGAGTLASAKEHKNAKVIWVDSDGFETNADDKKAQKTILTSVMKEIDSSVVDVTKKTEAGKYDNDPYVGTLENGGVGLAPYHEFEDDVPSELKGEIDQLKKDIISGKVKVESKASPES